MSNETTKPEVSEQNETETGDSSRASFEEQLQKVIGNVRQVSAATDDKPQVLAFKDGVTREKLRESLGIDADKDNNMTQFLGQARSFLKFQTMKVDYKGKVITGQQLQKEVGIPARGKFIDYCKEQLKPATESPTFKVVREGTELPTFSTRSTNQPDAFDLLAGLSASVNVSDES